MRNSIWPFFITLNVVFADIQTTRNQCLEHLSEMNSSVEVSHLEQRVSDIGFDIGLGFPESSVLRRIGLSENVFLHARCVCLNKEDLLGTNIIQQQYRPFNQMELYLDEWARENYTQDNTNLYIQAACSTENQSPEEIELSRLRWRERVAGEQLPDNELRRINELEEIVRAYQAQHVGRAFELPAGHEQNPYSYVRRKEELLLRGVSSSQAMVDEYMTVVNFRTENDEEFNLNGSGTIDYLSRNNAQEVIRHAYRFIMNRSDMMQTFSENLSDRVIRRINQRYGVCQTESEVCKEQIDSLVQCMTSQIVEITSSENECQREFRNSVVAKIGELNESDSARRMLQGMRGFLNNIYDEALRISFFLIQRSLNTDSGAAGHIFDLRHRINRNLQKVQCQSERRLAMIDAFKRSNRCSQSHPCELRIEGLFSEQRRGRKLRNAVNGICPQNSFWHSRRHRCLMQFTSTQDFLEAYKSLGREVASELRNCVASETHISEDYINGTAGLLNGAGCPITP